MTIVKFAPFLSTAEASFWTKLAKMKLDEFKLSEEPIEIIGSYTVLANNSKTVGQPPPPARLRVDTDSFVHHGSDSSATAVRNEAVQCPGKILLLNTAESFKRLDKRMLLDEAGRRILQCCTTADGQKCDDLSPLTQFLCVSFLDLKKHTAVYWFAFPALAPKSALRYYKDDEHGVVGAQPLEQCIGASACFKFSQAVSLMRHGQDHFRCPAYFITIHLPLQRNSGNISNDQALEQIRCVPLSKYDELSTIEKESSVFCFVDPCLLPENPGWPMRNLAAYLGMRLKLKSAKMIAYRPGALRRIQPEHVEFSSARNQSLDSSDIASDEGFVAIAGSHGDRSLFMSISLDVNWKDYHVVGWETNTRNKMGPRSMNLKTVMDESIIAQQSVDLNLKLMRWRLLPDLNIELLSNTKCLLLGAGTLGCTVSRTLMAWGVRNITFLDNGRVSYSNPVRQSLFEIKDCGSNGAGGAFKAIAAADALKRIFPGVTSRGIVATIPMPGHAIGNTEESVVKNDWKIIDGLIKEHDVIFLLTDTRESRWLPTIIASSYDKTLLNAALGLDSWLVMRHGCWPDDQQTQTRLGCYFCNDVVAPENSMRERTLDQQCTVTRPGLAHIAASMAVELMVGILHHDQKHRASANPIDSASSSLGLLPHQIRGFLSAYSMMTPKTPSFDCCTACSENVVSEYRRDGFKFVRRVCGDTSYLEEISGLKKLREQTDNLEVDWDLDDEDDKEINDIGSNSD